jgi:hypothetical protein
MSEFMIRKNGARWWVWQWETGRKYVRLETPHDSRTAAQAWIKSVTPKTD